jgi:hypothetical protein
LMASDLPAYGLTNADARAARLAGCCYYG